MRLGRQGPSGAKAPRERRVPVLCLGLEHGPTMLRAVRAQEMKELLEGLLGNGGRNAATTAGRRVLELVHYIRVFRPFRMVCRLFLLSVVLWSLPVQAPQQQILTGPISRCDRLRGPPQMPTLWVWKQTRKAGVDPTYYEVQFRSYIPVREHESS